MWKHLCCLVGWYLFMAESCKGVSMAVCMVEGRCAWWRNVGSMIGLPPPACPDTPPCMVPWQPPLPKLSHTYKAFSFSSKNWSQWPIKEILAFDNLNTSPNLVIIFLEFTDTRVQNSAVTMLILLSISTSITVSIILKKWGQQLSSKNCDKYILSTLCIAWHAGSYWVRQAGWCRLLCITLHV